MALLKIARMGHPVLLRRCDPVPDPGAPEIRRLVRDMMQTMEDAPGVGLAAPQVYVPLRLFVFRIPGERAGADPDYAINVRVVSERAWATLFAYNMFLRPSADELQTMVPDFTVLHAPLFQAHPDYHGTRTAAVGAVRPAVSRWNQAPVACALKGDSAGNGDGGARVSDMAPAMDSCGGMAGCEGNPGRSRKAHCRWSGPSCPGWEGQWRQWAKARQPGGNRTVKRASRSGYWC